MSVEFKRVRFLAALRLRLLQEIAMQRREYCAEEPDGSWATNDAHELETWAHRHTQPQSATLNW